MTVIDIYDIWQKLMSRVNVQQGGQIRPVSDFEKWYNIVSDLLFRRKVASAELNQMTDDDLAPFLKTVNILCVNQAGKPYSIAAYPADYSGYASMRISRQKETDGEGNGIPIIDGTGKCFMYNDPDYAQMTQSFAGANLIEAAVNKIDNQRWAGCRSHDKKNPTYESPKCTQFVSGFKVAPKGLQSVVLDYYKTPRRAVFGYTIVNDVVIYDSTASTQLEWPNTMENEFLVELEKAYGMAVRENEVYQMAENDKKSIV